MSKKLEKITIDLLSRRNLELLDPCWTPSNKTNFKNFAYLDGRKIPSEYIGFHVGVPNQNILIPKRIHEDIDLDFGRVFFSTHFSDLSHYFNFLEENMIYFVDLRRVSGIAQKVYSHKVIFQDDICGFVSMYLKKECSKEDLRERIRDWERKYTIPYNRNRIERYKKSKNYLLLDAPIKVIN